MSKIFRLYKEGASTYEDWNSSPVFPYNSASRDTIEDPDGASARYEITSIPSPFARIDLIKTAFKEVCKHKNNESPDFDGKTIFHKMVSDTFDVAEIFFNLEKLEGKVEVIKWDYSIMLKELSDSNIPGHKYLADALSKYMSSDARTYNFDSLQNIYLLNYVHGPNELNIIGATSPATLFFSNANNLEYVNDIFFGEDKPFDSVYQPLYKRDFEFVKYFFALRKKIENFAGLFPEIDTYLEQTFSKINDQAKRAELNSLTPTTLDDHYSTISVTDMQQNDIVEVLGNPLYMKGSRPVTTISDFIIKTTKECGLTPLVLPVEAGNRYKELQYTTSQWGNTNAAPFVDAESDLTKRHLPFDGAINPYLTISDFLEDTIIRVPYTQNVENYFNGNITNSEKEQTYLLPLKPLLFEYFSPEEIRGNMNDGKPMLEMTILGGGTGVRFTLRVPVKGARNINYVEYSRIYYKDRGAVVSNNEGGMAEVKFTGFIMPQVKFINEQDAIYNISCVQSAKGKNEFNFFSGGRKLTIDSTTCRNEDQQIMVKADNYLLEKKNFDFIQLCNIDKHCGILLPIFKQQRNTEQFEFSIDLGTSNTHIEFRKGNENPEVFTFTARDSQLCEMFIPEKNEFGSIENLIEETELIEKDFIPSEIGTPDFHFPTRTVLSCAKTIDWNRLVHPFTLVNIPFTYDKRRELVYNNFRCNIKWGKDDLRVMESYVQCLMLIIRNKVLLNNGDLNKTKITWFYPISMSPVRLTKLKNVWNEAYKKYFSDGVTRCMTESAAPIQYFFKRYATATDLINVDIGGGTTDIAFAKDKNISHVTSFRFASNVLFENSFSDIDDNNGIVDWHKDKILKVLEEKNLNELISVFNSPNNKKPANMASFLFGLKDNSIPQRANVNSNAIDFNYLLQEDEHFKIVFIIFYTAIIYHIALIVKSQGLEVPRHISFSGNGSKVIRVITTDSELLARYTKVVFEKVLGTPYGKELELLGLEKDSNPKESTSKGGIIGTEDNVNNVRTVVFNGSSVKEDDTYDSLSDDVKGQMITAVERFFKFVLDDMNNAFPFDRNFGVDSSSVNIAKEIASKDLLTFLNKGISLRCEESKSEAKIEETLFYYPIKGVLNALSAEIYKEKQQ